MKSNTYTIQHSTCYDFEARQLDSKLGCFTSIDPLAEKYYGISPYAYCAGDPVNKVDSDGRWVHLLVGATAGAVIEGGIALLNGESGKDIAKAAVSGTANGLLIATGAGLVASVAGLVAIEAGCEYGFDGEVNYKKCAEAGALSFVGGKIGGRAATKLEGAIYSKSAVRESKQVAKKDLMKESKVKPFSTANDKIVKDKAKEIRKNRMDIGKQTIGHTVQAGTTVTSKLIEKLEEKLEEK